MGIPSSPLHTANGATSTSFPIPQSPITSVKGSMYANLDTRIDRIWIEICLNVRRMFMVGKGEDEEAGDDIGMLLFPLALLVLLATVASCSCCSWFC